MESTCANNFLPIFVHCHRLDKGCEDGMRAGADEVHAGRCHVPIVRAIVNDSLHFIVISHVPLRRILEERLSLILSYLQLCLPARVK